MNFIMFQQIENKLGEVLNKVMNKTNAHIIAMTGSYFRGDNIGSFTRR